MSTTLDQRPNEPIKIETTLLAERLRQLADWCDRHPEIAAKCFTTRVHAYERDIPLEVQIQDTRVMAKVIGLDQLVFTGTGSSGECHYRAVIDGVEISCCGDKL